MRLESERLILRFPESKDAKELHRLRTNLEVTQYIGRNTQMGISDVEMFIQSRNQNLEDGIYWVICLKETQELIGAICLWNRNIESHYAELGYELLPMFQRKGIMSEAFQSVLKLAFDALDVLKVEAFTHRENLPSRKLLERFNFVHLPTRSDPDVPNNVIYRLEKANFNRS